MSGICKDLINHSQLDIFHVPARIIIAGQSHSGKSMVTTELIRRNFSRFDRVVISGADESSFALSKEMNRNITFYDHLINPFEEILFDGCRLLYVIEDMYLTALNSKDIALAFAKGRHKHINIIITSQSLFTKNAKYGRDISLNTSHYILTRQRDVSQVETLGRQVFGKSKSKSFLQAYQNVMKEFTYGHVLIDLQCRTPDEIQVRSNIFRNDYPFELAYKL